MLMSFCWVFSSGCIVNFQQEKEGWHLEVDLQWRRKLQKLIHLSLLLSDEIS